MAMGRRKQERQSEFWVIAQNWPGSPGPPFYEQLNPLLDEAGFDRFCEGIGRPFYAETIGRPSIPPGVCFRMLMVGYFEKIDSERGIAWRCSDSLSLRSFLGLKPEDGSTMEANAAMRSIVRRKTGQSYREFLEDLAKESGIETPTAEDLAQFDRKRKSKRCSNDDGFNPHDPDAKIAKMKDGTTHLAHKNEHAGDPSTSLRTRLETGAIVAPAVHSADEGDTTTLPGTLEPACTSLQEVRADETVQAEPSRLYVEEVVVDKGYPSGQTLVDLEEVDFRGYVSKLDRGRRQWTAGSAAGRAGRVDLRRPRTADRGDARPRVEAEEVSGRVS